MKTAVITGASRGLGRETAITLSGRGFDVIVNYLRSSAEAEEVVRGIAGASISIKADVSRPGEVEKMAEIVKKEIRKGRCTYKQCRYYEGRAGDKIQRGRLGQNHGGESERMF